MKHKTWFRLVLKAIGVLLIGLSITPLAQSLLSIIVYGSDLWTIWSPYSMNTTPASRTASEILWGIAHMILPAGLQLALGLYLLCRGKWLVDKCIPSNRAYCPDCGYDLSSSAGTNCPECGVTLPSPASAS
jgi:hypothetical protein